MDCVYCQKNEATDKKRRMYFFLVDATDAKTPETGEDGNQPQISIDGAAWTSAGIGTLVHIGNGMYYAELTQATVNVDHAIILGRFKSANTIESPALNAIEVGGYRNGIASLANELVLDRSTGELKVYNDAGYAGGTVIATFTPTDVDSNTVRWART